jgi:hypothetical protein
VLADVHGCLGWVCGARIGAGMCGEGEAGDGNEAGWCGDGVKISTGGGR